MALLTSIVKGLVPDAQGRSDQTQINTEPFMVTKPFPDSWTAILKEMNVACLDSYVSEAFLLKEIACAQGRRQEKKKCQFSIRRGELLL